MSGTWRSVSGRTCVSPLATRLRWLLAARFAANWASSAWHQALSWKNTFSSGLKLVGPEKLSSAFFFLVASCCLVSERLAPHPFFYLCWLLGTSVQEITDNDLYLPLLPVPVRR